MAKFPVHRLLRPDARRNQPRRRRAAARLHRSRRPAADAHRRHQIHRAVLGSSGLRAARSGGAAAGRGEGFHLDRHRARAPHRPARGIQRGDQSRRRRRQAEGRELRFLARRDQGAQRRGDLGRELPRGERGADRRRRNAGPRLVPRARLPRQAVLAADVVPLSEAGRSRACASSSPTRSACCASAASSSAACTSTASPGGTSSSPNTRRCRIGATWARCGKTRSPSTSRCTSPIIRSGSSPRAACNIPGATMSASS